MASQVDIRKFVFQNSASSKVWEVTLGRDSTGAISGVGRQIGALGGFGNASQNSQDSSPGYDNTEVTFVVITARLADAMGVLAKHETYLAQRAMYDAAAPGGAGAALSTLLV